MRQRIQRAGLLASRYDYLSSLERQKEEPNFSRAYDLSLTASRYMDVERRLQEKLQKLLNFNSQSAHLFASVDPLLAAVQQGLRQVRNSWNASSQSFVIPSRNDLEWVETVNKAWDKRIENSGKDLYEQFKDIMDSDAAKRLSQMMALLPNTFIDDVLKSDGFWEILSTVDKSGAKGQKAVDYILKGLVKYESLGKNSQVFSKLFEYLENISTPIKSSVKWGLDKLSHINSLETAVSKGKNFVGEAKFLGKGIKFLGKVGTALTFATIAFEGISGGVEEYSKSKNIGKAVGRGLLDSVASVDPLEGATVGAAVGGVPGAVVGAGIGLVIQGIKWFEPKFFDDPVKGTKNIISKVGKGIRSVASAVSNTFGGIGKALGFS